MIVAGRVMVNGQVVTQLGSKADQARDHIRVDGKLLQGAERHRYFVLNKPKGYVTTVSDPEGRPTVMEFFAKMGERLYPVGRLDYQSEGLLLMTNDGELANLLTKAGSGVEKTYLVKVAGQPSEEELERLRGGVTIDRDEAGSKRVRTAPARVQQVREGDNPWYEVVLTEGRNRELRKMFSAVGHFVEKIRRVGYGPLVLDVEPGMMRELTADEVTALRLTAEGKMKPRHAKVDRALPREAGRGAERRFEATADPRRDQTAGRRFEKRPERGGKPFQRREERGPKREWRPRESGFGAGREGGGFKSGAKTGFGERTGKPFGAGPRFERPRFDRPGFDKPGVAKPGGERSADKPRGFGEQSLPGFDARPKFGARAKFSARPPVQGGQRTEQSGSRFGAQRPFGGGRPASGPRPRFDRPRFEKPGFGGGPPREQAGGGFGGAPRKPFRAPGQRPYFKPGGAPRNHSAAGPRRDSIRVRRRAGRNGRTGARMTGHGVGLAGRSDLRPRSAERVGREEMRTQERGGRSRRLG